MKKAIFILTLIMLTACSCKSRVERPFQYNKSGTLFSGAFAISPNYFAELTVNIDKCECTVLINGRKTYIELPIPKDSEYYSLIMCVDTRDINEDGYVDFILTPNCDARFPPSYAYLFDKEKECFVLYEEDDDDDWSDDFFDEDFDLTDNELTSIEEKTWAENFYLRHK